MTEARDDVTASLVRQIYFEKRRAERAEDTVRLLEAEVADLRASRSELWRYALKDAALTS